MKIPILLISEFIGVVAVVIILSISPVIRNKRPLRFLYPRREGTAAATVGILILVLTAVVQRFQPELFSQLMNFSTYPTLVNVPKQSYASLNTITAQVLFSAAMIAPIALGLFARRQPLLSIGLSKPGLRAGLQVGAALFILVIFLQGKIFAIINGLTQGAYLTLIVAFVAAIGEEAVFRGYIQPRFTAWIGDRWGWLAAVLLYVAWWALPTIASYSGDSTSLVVGILYRLTLGLLLGWIMRKTGSLAAPILYHTVHMWLAFM
jgi:membrane protease YdiL (CAAX protease family)